VEILRVKFKEVAPDLVRACEPRFMAKVAVKGADECWPWQGALKDNGYGYFRLSAQAGMVSAHKFAWLAHRGSTNGLYVCHSCDVRSCCNPAHLWLGTAKENQQDMAKKGRTKSHAKGNLAVKRDSAGRFKEN
jgi:hypothetical protein